MQTITIDATPFDIIRSNIASSHRDSGTNEVNTDSTTAIDRKSAGTIRRTGTESVLTVATTELRDEWNRLR